MLDQRSGVHENDLCRSLVIIITYFQSFGLFSESATAGAMIAIEECEQQFQWDRWNCPKSSVARVNENSFPTGNK